MSCERVWAALAFCARVGAGVWFRARERGLVCAGRVDKWEGRGREPVSVGSLSLSFFLLLWGGWRVLNPLPPPWGGGVPSDVLRRIKRGRGLRSWAVLLCLSAAVLVSRVPYVSWSASALASKL